MAEALMFNTWMELWYAGIISVFIIVILRLLSTGKLRRTRVSLSIVAVVFLVMATQSNVRLMKVKSNADRLVVCCEQYKQKYGEYPEKLADLVPEFIDSIPSARYGRYHYFSREEKHVLGFNSVGFLKTDYNFETKTWRSWD